jgi:uncharacterized protein (TIGR03083 family)
MTRVPHEDEIAPLLALDALESDEQADAELRMGTFPDGFATAAASLAESVTEAPPPDLRRAVLARARSRRAPGRPIGAAVPCAPLDAFVRTVADFAELLGTLTDAEWEADAHAEHGTVRDLVAHLAGIERLSIRWLDQDDVPQLLDHVASTRPVIAELANTSARDVARHWHETARQVATAAARGDQRRRVTFHDLRISVAGFLVTRTFELWAHGMDIAMATGRALPALDEQRMSLLSSELMTFVPQALAYRRSSVPGRTVRFVLTGSAGGVYDVPLAPGDGAGEPDAVVVVDTVDLCRVAARRLAPMQLDTRVEGDRELVGRVLADLDALARD